MGPGFIIWFLEFWASGGIVHGWIVVVFVIIVRNDNGLNRRN
jgi:hypothetical protein